jgi:hypothetical protein
VPHLEKLTRHCLRGTRAYTRGLFLLSGGEDTGGLALGKRGAHHFCHLKRKVAKFAGLQSIKILARDKKTTTKQEARM